MPHLIYQYFIETLNTDIEKKEQIMQLKQKAHTKKSGVLVGVR